MRNRTTAALVATAITGLAAVLAPSAHAAPPDNVHERWTEEWLEPDFCGTGLDVSVTKSLGEHRLEVRRGPDGLIWFHASFSEVLTYRNPVSGAALTLDRRFTDRDARLTASADGTYVYTEALSGVQKTIGPDGRVLFVDAGITKWQLLLDADLHVVDFLGVALDGGRKDTANRDFCADFVTYTS